MDLPGHRGNHVSTWSTSASCRSALASEEHLKVYLAACGATDLQCVTWHAAITWGGAQA